MKHIELAKQLARALAESGEFRSYESARKNLDEHEAAKAMMEDFRKKQWEYEKKRMNGDKLLEPFEDELRKLSEIIGLNPYVREYLIAEYQFSQMMLEIDKIIGEAVGLKAPEMDAAIGREGK
jgi:cell fate (sporulation/competence/biofilm development) regulator YlbF (YheA/YmcA/DUF963 family)